MEAPKVRATAPLMAAPMAAPMAAGVWMGTAPLRVGTFRWGPVKITARAEVEELLRIQESVWNVCRTQIAIPFMGCRLTVTSTFAWIMPALLSMWMIVWVKPVVVTALVKTC